MSLDTPKRFVPHNGSAVVSGVHTVHSVWSSFRLAALCLALLPFLSFTASAADTLNWNTNQNRVSADLKDTKLLGVLEQIASATRWNIFVEPEALHPVSAKFSNLPTGEALRMLLGDVNYALVPASTNATTRLYVFRTSRQNATRLIEPAKEAEARAKAKLIPNELIVRLKPGAKIDDLARLLGAKVIGRIDSLNAYRLQFDDQAAADAAREQLASNPDVQSVDSNYAVEPPPNPTKLASSAGGPPQLKLDPPPDGCQVIVGLVDTALQPLGNNLDQFLLKPISVAGNAQLDPNAPSHGTSMAQSVLQSLGVASGGHTSAKLLSVDVYGPNATTSTFDVANGIAQAVNGGAKIVNLSLGSAGDSPFLHSVITDASSKNILFIGAAGNTPVTTPFYPAAYPEVNAVTAIDQGQLAPYANRGSFVTLGAPGGNTVYYNNQAWYVQGTSTSAALTSGIAASYLQANPCATTANSDAFLRRNLGVTITPAGP